MVAAGEGFGHRRRHLVLTRTLRTLDALDRGSENRFGLIGLGHRNNLPRASDTDFVRPAPIKVSAQAAR